MRVAQETGAEFHDEAAAERWTIERLFPYCSDILPQRPLRESGLKPDLTARLHDLQDRWFLIEIKRFFSDRLVPLPEAIAQAADYAHQAQAPCFVGPLFHRGWTEWTENPRAVAAIVASHFSVGVLNFAHWPNPQQHVGGLLLGGVWVARFGKDRSGRPTTELHRDARHLMQFKQRRGSVARRALGEE